MPIANFAICAIFCYLILCNILLQCSVPEGELHCQCRLSIFPANQFYANILVFVNINPFLYTNDQFALVIQKTFAFFINALVICHAKICLVNTFYYVLLLRIYVVKISLTNDVISFFSTQSIERMLMPEFP
jgi:hypothetical protein